MSITLNTEEVEVNVRCMVSSSADQLSIENALEEGMEADMKDRFSAANNARELRHGEFRVWRYGESMVVRSLTAAHRAIAFAQRIDPDAHAVRYGGWRVKP